MKVSRAHNFFFHPLAKEHSKKVKILSTITVIALSIITGLAFLGAFVIVNLRDRKIHGKNNKYPKPTETILRNKYGFKYSAHEPNKHLHLGYIGPMQGHRKFRAKVGKVTEKNIDALSPKALRENRHINPQLSLYLTAKRVGHALSLRGEIILEDTAVNLEGFSEVYTLPMIADSFEQFAEASPDLVSKDMKKWVLEHFINSTRCDAINDQQIVDKVKELNDPNFKGPLCASTGYDWHGTFLIFFRNFVFAANRGADPYELKVEGENIQNLGGSGVSIFKSEKSFNLSLETAIKIFKRMAVNRNNYAKLNDIQKELDLHFLDLKRSKNQSVGNCTYVNTKLAILVLLALYSLRNSEKITTPDLDEAFEKAKEIYKEWVKFERNYVVKDVIDEMQSLREQEKTDSLVYKVLKELLPHIYKKRYRLSIDLGIKINDLLK